MASANSGSVKHVDDGIVLQSENSKTFTGDFQGGISKKPDMAPKKTGDTTECQKNEHLYVEQTQGRFVYLLSSKRTLFKLKLFNTKSFLFRRC
jgi:hypothetical protein